MSVNVPIHVPAIPSPNDDPSAMVQTLWAIKQNIEVAQGTRGVVARSTLHGPTLVNTQIGAAIRAVTP
jgi:hypothetical protein